MSRSPPEPVVVASPVAEPVPDLSERRDETSTPASGMHTSFEVPPAPPLPRRYLSVRTKFAIAVTTATLWTGASVWISAPWVSGLATHVTILPAILIVSLLAFIPGFVMAFLMAGLAFDRQPPLRVTSPHEPVTVLIAARNEGAAIGETVRSLAQQDYEGPLRVIVIDNGSTTIARVAVARATAEREIGFEIDVLYRRQRRGKEVTPLNLGVGQCHQSSCNHRRRADTLLQRSALRLLIARLMSSRTRSERRGRGGAGAQQPQHLLEPLTDLGLLLGHRVREEDAGSLSEHPGSTRGVQPLPERRGARRGRLARRHRRGHRAHLEDDEQRSSRLLRTVGRQLSPALPRHSGYWHVNVHVGRAE